MGKNKYAILILAAGGSRRLGRPKQLVEWEQSTLLNHTINQALNASNCDVYVALGGNQEAITPSITVNVQIIDIPNWKEGMGSSISTSLDQIVLDKYEAIILSVCDQPYISASVFGSLMLEFERKKSSIVISKYKNAFGPPTLFGKKQFEHLLKLQGDTGAKSIIRNCSEEEIAIIQFENGAIDIDTDTDLKKLMSTKKGH